MKSNLWGIYLPEASDYADRCLDYIRKRPIHPVIFHETNKGVVVESSKPVYDEKGFLLFYNIDSNPPKLVALTRGNAQDRVYRFGKELLGKSRPDEGFSRVKKLKKYDELESYSVGYQYTSYSELISNDCLPQDYNSNNLFCKTIKKSMIDKGIFKK